MESLTDVEFFTEADLQLLYKHGGEVYVKSSEADEAIRDLRAGVWSKTKEWGDLVQATGFRTECRRHIVKQAGRTPKQGDGKRYRRQVFRPYSWAKLYRPSEKEYGVFFTVGVDGKSRSLMWKLDCKRAGSNALDPKLVRRFDEYLGYNAVPKGVASIDELKQYDWDKLVVATQQFIIDNLAHYEAALAYTWQGSI